MTMLRLPRMSFKHEDAAATFFMLEISKEKYILIFLETMFIQE
jgi:hypothetical protein